MPEKLLNIQEVAKYLVLPEEEVKRLVDIGEIPAYKIGGTFLRFRLEQIQAIKDEVNSLESSVEKKPEVSVDAKGHESRPYTDLEREIKKREPVIRQYDYTFLERMRDLWYFKDFYILSSLVIALIIYIVVK